MSDGRLEHSIQGVTLADILDRVLDKGVIVAGDVAVSLVGVELLNIRIRLLIASVDKAIEMGINWWINDPHLSVQAREAGEERRALQDRVGRLEAMLARAATPEQER